MNRHPIEPLSLISGVLFGLFALSYGITAATGGNPYAQVTVPLLLVGLAAAGVVAAVGAQRRSDRGDTAAGSAAHPESASWLADAPAPGYGDSTWSAPDVSAAADPPVAYDPVQDPGSPTIPVESEDRPPEVTEVTDRDSVPRPDEQVQPVPTQESDDTPESGGLTEQVTEVLDRHADPERASRQGPEPQLR